MICSALILAFVTLQATEQRDEALVVMVSDATDSVISDATGRLLSAERVIQAGASKSGEILFRNVSPGTYRLEVSSIGFATTTVKEVVVPQTESKRIEVTLRVADQPDPCGFVNTVEYGPLQPGTALSGRVIDTDSSRAIAKAWVDLQPADKGDALASTRSDKNGTFLFATLQPGHYVVRVSKNSYRPSLGNFFIAHENTTTLIMGLDKRGHMHICQ